MVQRWNGRGGRRMWIGVVVVIVVVQERRQSDVYLRRLQFIPLSRQGFQVKRLVQLLIQTHHWYCGSGGGVALSSNRCCQLGLGRLTNRVDCHAHSLDNTDSMVLQFCDYGGIYCDRCFLEFLGHDLVVESIPLRHLVEHCGDLFEREVVQHDLWRTVRNVRENSGPNKERTRSHECVVPLHNNRSRFVSEPCAVKNRIKQS